MKTKYKRSQEKRITRRAQIVRFMRIARRKSQSEAAALCECSEQAIGHYENGRMEISEQRLAKLLKAYDFTSKDFDEFARGKEMPVDFKNECISILSQLDEAKLRLVHGLLTNFVGTKPVLV